MSPGSAVTDFRLNLRDKLIKTCLVTRLDQMI